MIVRVYQLKSPPPNTAMIYNAASSPGSFIEKLGTEPQLLISWLYFGIPVYFPHTFVIQNAASSPASLVISLKHWK